MLQLKYQKSEDETNGDEEMTNLESVRVLEGVALQHGFVGRSVRSSPLIFQSNINFK